MKIKNLLRETLLQNFI